MALNYQGFVNLIKEWLGKDKPLPLPYQEPPPSMIAILFDVEHSLQETRNVIWSSPQAPLGSYGRVDGIDLNADETILYHQIVVEPALVVIDVVSDFRLEPVHPIYLKPGMDWELTNDFENHPNGFKLVRKEEETK